MLPCVAAKAVHNATVEAEGAAAWLAQRNAAQAAAAARGDDAAFGTAGAADGAADYGAASTGGGRLPPGFLTGMSPVQVPRRIAPPIASE